MIPVRRVSLLVAGGVFLALFLAAIFRGPLLEQLIVTALRQKLGLDATIAQVGGLCRLRSRAPRGERARGGRGRTRRRFDAERISARYALSALLRGNEAFLDSLDVTVEGARLDLDLTAPPAPRAEARRTVDRRPRSLPATAAAHGARFPGAGQRPGVHARGRRAAGRGGARRPGARAGRGPPGRTLLAAAPRAAGGDALPRDHRHRSAPRAWRSSRRR